MHYRRILAMRHQHVLTFSAFTPRQTFLLKINHKETVSLFLLLRFAQQINAIIIQISCSHTNKLQLRPYAIIMDFFLY